MTSWQFGVATPVHYLRSGQFTADLGWQHHVMTHGADLELIIGLQGSVALAVGAAGYQVEPGDVLTVFPHETIRGTRPTLVPSAFIWFHVVPTSVERPVRLPRFFHLADQAQAVIAAKQLLDIAHGEHRLAALADYQATVAVLQLANDAANQAAGVGQQQSTINQVKEWIRVHMAQPLTVPQVAAAFHLNADYLTRQFRQQTGLTVKGYMNAVRLDYAKYLLLTTDRPVQEVAHRAYFADEKYFSRLFKAKVALSPRQYRLAYTHTFLNNKQVDPGIDVHSQVAALEQVRQ
ncbi:helix-turn-helix transcriptional regulator [Lacticaseibacillus nasuensis]|uniref:Transcriptional regulator, AraC family n=2 Tax=Lacticaseibacillus TaxID=2759736 RepID=A0A0R1JQ29_9LACO|nr:helix-turn-helix transcriptional regulator [Lacticaseibacillus nasuensis]KRK70484.1 transcriptional regulator, AraC family [Lacticaseibacillus nasuensis JCM 17158]